MNLRDRPDVHTCQTCGNPYLEGYPHHHATDPQPGYDPMPPRPESVSAMLAVIRREWRHEIPDRSHVRYVPQMPVMTPLTADPDGPSAPMLDTGELGSPSWSPPFHRRIGAITYWHGEQTVDEGDLSMFPWEFAIQKRIDRWCRARHGNRPDLWREHRGRPICKPLVQLLVYSEPAYSIGKAALAFEMTPERARLVLGEALPRLWGQVSNLLNRLPYAA